MQRAVHRRAGAPRIPTTVNGLSSCLTKTAVTPCSVPVCRPACSAVHRPLRHLAPLRTGRWRSVVSGQFEVLLAPRNDSGLGNIRCFDAAQEIVGVARGKRIAHSPGVGGEVFVAVPADVIARYRMRNTEYSSRLTELERAPTIRSWCR